MSCDILIVGGGPAGVVAAYTAAKMGMHVILTDTKTKKEIGNKTCGDALNLNAPTLLKEKLGLALPHDKEVSDIVETMVIQTETQSIEVEGDGYVVDRHVYGQRLLAEAISAGVEIRQEMKAVRSLTEGDWVTGAEFKNGASGKAESINAKVSIDCTGRNFILRKTLPREKFPLLEYEMKPDEIVASYREIVRLKEDHEYHKKIYLIYNAEIPEPGYYWIFSKGPHELNLGVGWKLSVPGKGNNMRAIYNQVTKKYFPEGSYEIISGEGYTIPTRYPLFNAVANGFMTAGDAAFHVDPFTAEGHGPALMAGYYAGKQAVEAIQSGRPTTQSLWEYNKNCMTAFGTLHCKTQLFTEVLLAIRMKGFDHILKRKVLNTEDFSAINRGEKLGLLNKINKLIRVSPKYALLLKFDRLAKGTRTVERFMAEYPRDVKDYTNWYTRFFPWFSSYMKSF
ncbi:MAG TPA: NAD(P)/FAD-dependent oxidoreductase [Candidatus Hodarchaeales archaeon]|nr:NAD(P)/FAD-dependent oxidoreductase [Candidatus Hodarchaeales archaeon]